MAKRCATSESRLRTRHAAFKRDCTNAYWEFKYIARKIGKLTKQATLLNHKVGMLVDGTCNPSLMPCLGDFEQLVLPAISTIDMVLNNARRTTFKKPSERSK